MTKPYHLVVRPEYRITINIYYEMILAHIDNEQNVPYKIVKGFLRLLNDEQAYNREMLHQKADKLSKKVIERLSKYPDYQFKWSSDIEYHEGKKLEIKNNSEKIFTQCILAFLLYEKDNDETTKDEAIQFFFEALSEWYKRQLLKTYQKNFTKYRMIVLSGILSETVGYKISNKKENLTHKQIYNYCYYSIV